jgi:hypothetical protein
MIPLFKSYIITKKIVVKITGEQLPASGFAEGATVWWKQTHVDGRPNGPKDKNSVPTICHS